MSISKLLLVGVVALLCSFEESLGAKKPEIHITQVPPSDPGGPDKIDTIAGKVSGVDPSDYKVLLYVRTNQWYVQPTIDSPYTTIDKNGRWQSDTHLGREYAALLVPKSHKDAAATLNQRPTVGGAIAAADIQPGRIP